MFIRRIDIPKTTEDNDVRTTMLASGGIGLLGCAAPDLFNEWLEQLPSVCHNVGLTPDSYFTYVLEEVVDYLTADELEAVLLHEEGHYRLGHLDNACGGVLINQEIEYEADAYAADHCDVTVLIAALLKIRQFVLDVVLPALFGVDVMKIVIKQTEEACDAVMLPRIERLRTRL